jgi:hypothetical protein
MPKNLVVNRVRAWGDCEAPTGQGLASSIGTTSAVHASVSGSTRVRHVRAGFWEGRRTVDSIRRALATLIPAFRSRHLLAVLAAQFLVHGRLAGNVAASS